MDGPPDDIWLAEMDVSLDGWIDGRGAGLTDKRLVDRIDGRQNGWKTRWNGWLKSLIDDCLDG